MSFDLTNPIFTDENAAREHLESVLWPDGPVCPHCGSVENIAKVEATGRQTKDAYKGGKHRPARPGLYYCNECKGQFTVTVGTVLERSKIALSKWVLAMHLMAASKKGVSAHQLHRMLGVTYKTAWFMAHRVREAMRDDNPGGMGGPGVSVEADETFIGTKRKPGKRPDGRRKRKTSADKMKVMSLVQRGGPVRSFVVENVNASTVQDVLFRNVHRTSDLLTDDAAYYKTVGKEFAGHRWVNHSKEEWARGVGIHVNTLENFFSIFKRGMKGVYQHCGEQHLQRYVTEFDFRYNTRIALGWTDAQRRDKAVKGITGKRLTYRRADEAKVA